MPFGRKTATLLVALALLGAPAALLRVLCVGHSCDEPESTASEVPFCSLPSGVKREVQAGFREGRSPEALAVTRRPSVAGNTALGRGGDLEPPWTSLGADDGGRIPILFAGTGVDPGARLPAGTSLDQVAPTVAEAVGLRRAHPEVRSGRAVAGVAAGEAPRLVVEVALRGVGSLDLEAEPGAWPVLKELMAGSASTMDGRVGSLPLDPAAALTTLGTGGLPAQHGITGTFVRNDSGELVEAFGPGAPVTVIAALGDDLDEGLGQRPRIGMVASHPADRGAIGGSWYVDVDRDDFVLARRDPAPAAARLLGSGYGADEVPDLLVAALEGPLARMDAALGAILRRAERAAGGSLMVVVTATGSASGAATAALSARDVAAEIEAGVAGREKVVEAAVPGGVYLDQGTLADLEVSEDEVLRVLREMTDPAGRRLFSDTFAAIAVSFARYC